MRVHKSTAAAPWLLLNATHDFVASVFFQETLKIEGVGEKLTVTDIQSCEADDLETAVDWVRDATATDGREHFVRYARTWVIAEGYPCAGKRDNGTVGA